MESCSCHRRGQTVDEESQFDAKIKERSDMCRFVFLNDVNNFNQEHSVGFRMVQTFQYGESKIKFLDAEDFKLEFTIDFSLPAQLSFQLEHSK